MKRIQAEEKGDIDLYLLAEIQTRGGITFRDESIVKTGNGYETCIHIYGFPAKLRDYWMTKSVIYRKRL